MNRYTESGDLDNALDGIAQRASRYTGRNLTWSVNGGVFRMGDDTHLGNLALTLGVGGRTLREVYMRMHHFGITPAEMETIRTRLVQG